MRRRPHASKHSSRTWIQTTRDRQAAFLCMWRVSAARKWLYAFRTARPVVRCRRVGRLRPVSAESGAAVVLRVVDGDTRDVVDDGRGRLRVRVLGINTPETKPPAQCWGAEATEFTEAALLNKRVVLVGDPSQDARDRYGRT